MPILGLALKGGQLLLGPLVSVFGSHHKNAVKKENSTLSYAQPKFENAVASIVQQWQSGIISGTEASGQLDQALSEYASNVSSIMQKSGRAGDTGDPHAGGKCNAACFILKNQYEPLIKNIKAQIASGTSVKTVSQQSKQEGLPSGPGAYQGVPDNPNVARAAGPIAKSAALLGLGGVPTPAGQGFQLTPAALGLGLLITLGLVIVISQTSGGRRRR